MSTAKRLQPVTVDAYLAGEAGAAVKHEYVGGFVYAMAGARNAHNAICVNVLAGLHAGLRGRPCRPFNSDTKVRIRLPTHVRFYYPDALVTCRPNPPTDTYQDEPVVIVEVLSEGTRRTDEGEKREAYLTIPALRAYVLVEPDAPAVVVYRRTAEGGFAREAVAGLDRALALPEIGVSLPLADVYEAVDLAPAAPAAAD